MALHLIGAPSRQELVDLPWSLPLEHWPDERLVGLPRGISRHVVRFVRAADVVYAVKELGLHAAEREYRLLRLLGRRRVPCVQVAGLVDGRTDETGAELEPALVTQHLEFSLPYRALFSSTLRPATAQRLLDALAVLLVRLHLAGVYWGDCSLSNTLFRRDAGSFAAYLVDAETAEHHERLSDGQRSYDLAMARTNIIGELMDLQDGELLDTAVDPVSTGDLIAARYDSLWQALTGREVFRTDERHRVDARIRRLNELGFDVAELEVSTDGAQVQIQPKVVDAGHHTRRLMRLTGLDVQENQARRLLNDLDASSAGHGAEPEQLVAHRWLTDVFTPVVEAVPPAFRGKLEPAEVFHEVLEHRWFLSEQEGRDVGLDRALENYLDGVLRHKPDEVAVLPADTTTLAIPPLTGPGPDPDVLVQEGGSRRGLAVLVVVALVVAGLLAGDRWLRHREVDALFERARSGRATIAYADGRVQAVLQYTSPALLSADVDPAVRASLQRLVTQAAGDRVGDLTRQTRATADVRVLPWHRTQLDARRSWLAYLAVRTDYERAVAADFDALYAPHPQLASGLESSRQAYRRMVPGQGDRVDATFGPPR